MAFQKTTVVPGFGYKADYFSITRIECLDSEVREACFSMKLFASEAVAKEPGAKGFPAGFVTFRREAFDLYFSKSAMAAAGRNVYEQAYCAIKDFTEAKKLPAEKRTAEQADLVTSATIQSDYGNDMAFDGAKDA